MTQVTKPLGHSEISWVIQSRVEGLEPAQLQLRDLLVSLCGTGKDQATKYVKALLPAFVQILKEALQKAEQPKLAFKDFVSNVPGWAYRH